MRHGWYVDHVDGDTLEAGLPTVRGAPSDDGRVELIVRRPAVGEREVTPEAELIVGEGLEGDTWRERGNRRMPGGVANPAAQLTLMNARAASLIAGSIDRWALAGDQLYVDLDLSAENLPPGSRLAIGSAVVEVSPDPHTGCAKFNARYGEAALRFVNSPVGRELNLRGINTMVINGGTVRVGDVIQKLSPDG
jgi:MOSC domain-containing protein YiiM